MGQPDLTTKGNMKKVTVKLYDWKALARLAINDICQQAGIPKHKGDFHYVTGLDRDNLPFLRIDISPLPSRRRRSTD